MAMFGEEVRYARRMRRLGLSLLLCGCTSSALSPEPGLTIELPGLGLRMDVPEGTEVSRGRSTRSADTRTIPWQGPVMVELAPGRRYPRTMTIDRTDEPADAGLDRRDGALRYRLVVSGGGMSEERELIGHIELAGQRLAVRCYCADEAGDEPSLGWCLAALRSLRK
ncbi:MAG: hypothetical protein H0T76_23285 [Nannocystis sp.]|nr:hypothetical protein [Nannocystis sp.]MBA3549409.1 hypothetical protein [Nannocystis sp.]